MHATVPGPKLNKHSVDMGEDTENTTVIIVGAGPVGLLVALRLGQQGVKTLVLEAHDTLLPTTRAMVYMPVVNSVLRGLGILDLVMQHAFLNTEGVAWRDPQGRVLARLPLGDNTSKTSIRDAAFEGVLLIGQAKMNGLILQEIQKHPSVQVRFGQRVVGINSSADCVDVMTTHANVVDGDRTWRARYVLGCDGTNSSVRRAMCIPFQGFTWPDFRMVGTDVVYDFVGENGWTPLNFVVDDEGDAAAVVAYTGEDDSKQRGPQWRIAFLEASNLPSSREEVRARALNRIPKYLKPSKDFTLNRADVFWMHQRCARQGRKGRVLLAGDALHCNNPVGGLGLTSGILDAYAYGNALTRVLIHAEDDSLLTRCAESRRQAWLDATDQLSRANLTRIRANKPGDVSARDDFFRRLNEDPLFPAVVRKNMDTMLPETFEAGVKTRNGE